MGSTFRAEPAGLPAGAAVPQVGIVTDSTACLPPELVAEYGIEVVPVELVINGKVYRDGVDITPEQFYSLLQEAKRPPTTSPASPGTYLDAFRRLAQRFNSILCLTVTARLSAMYDAARAAVELAREVLPGKSIRVLDSQTATMAQGFMALAAAREARRGGALEAVEAAARKLTPRVNVVAMLDTLHYLARGGRVPKVAAWVTSALQVKPLLEIKAGEVHLLERVRHRQKALSRLVELVAQRRSGNGNLHLAVFHAHAQEEAQALRDRMAQQLHPVELYLTQFTPVMGSHTGPGVMGVAFYYEGA